MTSKARDPLLFTPGPLTTSLSVKEAMLHDAGSWHFAFNAVVRRIRSKLLEITGLSADDGYDVIPMQGSGTFGVESVLGSTVPTTGKVLIIANGAYGERLAQIAKCLRLGRQVLRFGEDVAADPIAVGECLAADSALTHVAVVHCETTTGLLNPIHEIGEAVRAAGRTYIVDAMSSFAGVPIDFTAAGIDYLISSANKCIEGVPGFSFVFARRANLMRTEGFARSLSLDLLAQLKSFDKNGQFRFTPPTHAILAFEQALRELEAEGGVAGRGRRYEANHVRLLAGMKALGFEPFLAPAVQSYIITAFHYPKDGAFDFTRFYRGLSDRGYIIYPGKLTVADTFRIGTIGRIDENNIAELLQGIAAVWQSLRGGL